MADVAIVVILEIGLSISCVCHRPCWSTDRLLRRFDGYFLSMLEFVQLLPVLFQLEHRSHTFSSQTIFISVFYYMDFT